MNNKNTQMTNKHMTETIVFDPDMSEQQKDRVTEAFNSGYETKRITEIVAEFLVNNHPKGDELYESLKKENLINQ